MAVGYGNLVATIKAHSDAWFHATSSTMPGRCTLALFYEYFRVEKPVVNIMALQGLYNTDYRQFGESSEGILGALERSRKESLQPGER